MFYDPLERNGIGNLYRLETDPRLVLAPRVRGGLREFSIDCLQETQNGVLGNLVRKLLRMVPRFDGMISSSCVIEDFH